MPIDIYIGTLHTEDNYTYVAWPGLNPEDDGTSLRYTIYSGYPIRSLERAIFNSWRRFSVVAQTIIKLSGLPYMEYSRLDGLLLEYCSLLGLEAVQAHDKDCAIWFAYWTRRAKEEFGDEAYMSILQED